MLGLMSDLCKLIWCGFAGLFRSRASLQAEILVVCTENSIRIDLVAESLSVREDGCAAMLLPGAGHIAVQVEDPT